MEPITVTIEGAKRATGLGHTSVYKLIKQGKLQTVHVGRRTLVTVESIRALVSA